MGPAAFVIAILGCGEGDAPCQQVKIADARYESESACVAATEAQLIRHDDLPFPLVVAQCQAAGAAPARLVPAEVMMPEPPRQPPRQQPASVSLAARH